MKKNIYLNAGGGDEQYTPRYGVQFLVPHIQHLRKKTIWCPFDRDDSQFVTVLRENGFIVVNSHLDYGQDFFTYQPDFWDAIISNPPYKHKRKYFERAMSFQKPFALLLPANIISDSVIDKSMSDTIQFLIPDKRMRFFNKLTGNTGPAPTFKAIFVGVKIFQKQITIDNIDEKTI